MRPIIHIVHSTDGSWPRIAQEAADRVSRFCNPSSVILRGFPREKVIRARFTELLQFDCPVWMMDSDLWFIRPCRLPVITGDIVVGGLNEHAPLDQIMGGKFEGLDFKVRDSFNLSLVSLDMGSQVMRECVQNAIAYLDDFFGEKAPTHAEVFLNRAARDMGIMVARMSNYLNWCGNTNISPKAVALHAAEQKNKLQWLLKGVENADA